MTGSRAMLLAAILLALPHSSFSQTAQTPKDVLDRLQARVDTLLAKDQPPLFAWHLRSVKALALSEYATLTLSDETMTPRQKEVAPTAKDFVEYVGKMADGLDGDNANPEAYLKEGRRTLILAHPSEIDGTLQYTMVSLPKDWDASRAYPMFVGLHGSGPTNPLAYPSFAFGPQEPAKPGASESPTSGMIGLTPWGRGNRGWRGDAESDLFESIRLLQTFAKLDPDRWYITGHSSGADGCWAIVQHTPDLWAAAGLQSGSMTSGRPEWGLIPNMAYVPCHFLIGEKDPLPGRVPDMKEAHRIMTSLKDDSELVILPGVGHYPLTEEGLNEQARWMVRHVRKRPNRFVFTVDQATHPGVWGIRTMVDPWSQRLIQQPWPRFECEIKGQDVRVKTKGIHALRVDLGAEGLRMTGSVRLWINGKMVHDGPVPQKPLEFTKL